MLLQGLQGGVRALLGLPRRHMLGLAGADGGCAEGCAGLLVVLLLLLLLLLLSAASASENSPVMWSYGSKHSKPLRERSARCPALLDAAAAGTGPVPAAWGLSFTAASLLKAARRLLATAEVSSAAVAGAARAAAGPGAGVVQEEVPSDRVEALTGLRGGRLPSRP